ncbi:MAG: helix-turn-helix domain-containing protein [Acidimicrobiia bacterium]
MRKKAKAAASGPDAPQTTPAAVPTPSAPEGTQVAPRNAKDVGRHLRELRRERGLSRADVARSAGLTKRELAAYERGSTEIPDHELFCLAGSCGVDVDDLLPGRDDLRVGSSGSSLTIGNRTQAAAGSGPDDVLRTFADMINQLRVLVPGAPVPWRAEDMTALAQALGGTPASIEARLVEVTGASREEAAQMRAILVPTAGAADTFSLGADDPADRAAEFFAGPRAADPFAPPPPIAAEVDPARSPEPVHAMAGAPAPVDAMTGTPAPITAAPNATSVAPTRPDPFGFAPDPASASHVVSDPASPIAPPVGYVPASGDDSIPPYWGIGGEEIFLWGEQAAGAVHASSATPVMPLTIPVEPPVEAPVAVHVDPPAPPPATPDPAPLLATPDPAPSVATPDPAPVPDAPAPVAATATSPAPADTADMAWQVGGTIEGPGGDPAAAMRWALSDLRVPGDSTIHAVLDFAAGTGFGVLFRATVDGHDRMSGYSLDVDPLGGAYVVRQWVDNLPHWQTLAQTPSSPTRLYGRHEIVIGLVGDAMTASVDGVAVMAIPSLGEASVATGCEPARGHRVGLQATPTADVTVESFRATPA